MIIQVVCYSGHRGEETPREIRMGNNVVAVAEISDRWLSPDHRYFKIRGTDAALYIIRHDMETQHWELVYYRHSDSPDPMRLKS